MRIRSFVSFVVLLFSQSCFATLVTIDLPQLAGDYQARPDVPPSFGVLSRHCTITLPPDLEHIDSMRFLISGQCTHGTQYCHAEEPPIPFRAELAMTVAYSGSALDDFMGSVRPPEGEFLDQSDPIEFGGPGEPDPLDNLLSRPLEIWLDCVGFTYCIVYTDFYGTLTDVRIELDGSVPTTMSTFGEIKALFR